MLGMGGEFTYMACTNCGSIQLLSIPEDLGPYYPSDYYSFSSLRSSGFLRNLLKKIRIRAYFATGLNLFLPPFGGYWLKKLSPKFTDRIADVGCGNGQLLYELHVSGFEDLHGFDPFLENESQLGAGLKIWNKEFGQTNLYFDVVMLHHSFEHMAEPEQVLKTCFDRLNPGGTLLLRCPVSDAAVWKEKQSLWVQLDAPRHLTIPSTQGFVAVAQRCGFEVQEVVFDSTAFQFWGTALYEQGEKLDKEKVSVLFSEKQRVEWEQKAIQYNQEGVGDQACFFCFKPRKKVEA
jgi:SAM-dependent methyltransferase